MKSIISDFDGTLHDQNFEKNIESIKKFVSSGNIFIINTGRTYESIYNAIKDYAIPYKYLICGDGAVIYDKSGHKIYDKYIDDTLKKQILESLTKYKDTREIVFDNNYTLIQNSNEKISRAFIKLTDIKSDQKIADELNNNKNIKSYLSAHWINISSKEINKMVAIEYLEKKENLGTIYTIGDSVNDIEMLLKYNGYLMKINELKDDYHIPVVSSVEELIEII